MDIFVAYMYTQSGLIGFRDTRYVLQKRITLQCTHEVSYQCPLQGASWVTVVCGESSVCSNYFPQASSDASTTTSPAEEGEKGLLTLEDATLTRWQRPPGVTRGMMSDAYSRLEIQGEDE